MNAFPNMLNSFQYQFGSPSCANQHLLSSSRIAMLRTVWKTVAPRAAASGRLQATAAARRSNLILGPPCHGVAPLAFDLLAYARSSTRCQWRNMSSTSANVNVSTTGGDDSAQEGEGGEEGAGGEWDGRDPKTGEGIWVDDEDEVRSCVSCDTSSSTYSLGYDDRRAAQSRAAVHVQQCTNTTQWVMA